MAVNQFLGRFGFSADPFESTNAESEPLLTDYFVPPPYFATVLGDPAYPKSHVVLAPRGSGKTAQRRMIEEESAERGDFLCVTYDSFDQPPGFHVEDADLSYHLNQICRLLVLGVLAKLEDEPFLEENLTDAQKQVLKFQVNRFLGGLSVNEYETAVKSIKSLGDKAGEFWKKYGGPVAAGLQILMNKAGLKDVKIPAEIPSQQTQDESLTYHFRQLISIAQALWLSSVYVLVDKVDETPLTSANAQATYSLIRSLMTDLPTLEHPGVGFKFFTWDHIADVYRETGGRPDRVPILELNWSVYELIFMLEKRLLAYSGGRIGSLRQMCCDGTSLNLDLLVAYMAQGSPRDLIRISKSIVNEETRVNDSSPCIRESSIWEGIRHFADERAVELCPAYISELKKVQTPTFTIKSVASDVFHVEQQSARSKIQKWMTTGVVQQIGTLPNPGNRPMHLYGITDLRVAIAAQSALPVAEFLGNFALSCPDCDALVISAETSVSCPMCAADFTLSDCRSILDLCS